MQPNLNFYKLDPCVPSPAYKTASAACFDLYVSFKTLVQVSTKRDITINKNKDNTNYIMLFPNEQYIIGTGIIFDIPQGYSLDVFIRSGISATTSISLANGTGIIDEDYTNELGLILKVNQPTKLVEYSRIAQARIMESNQADFFELEAPPMPKGNRSGGFGSTGV